VDAFLSQELGLEEDRGVLVAGFKAMPLKGLTFGAIEVNIADVLNTAYDFSHIVADGLKFQARYGKGWGVVDFLTGIPLPDQNELNLELECHPSSGRLKDLYFQVFYSGVRFPGAPAPEESQPQLRSVVTYLVPAL